MRACAVGLIAACISAGSSAQSTWEHGRECAQALGVEVPRFSCLDGAEIPVNHNGRRILRGESTDRCDKPADGSSQCYPGSRILKFFDTITRNGREEKITTTILCRGGHRNATDPIFHDVAIIQHNEANNQVCWFNRLDNQDSTNVPPPFTASAPNEGQARFQANRYWGKAPTRLNCMECHDSGLYLRTPWIMQVTGQPSGSFVRNGGSGPYRRGGVHGFPREASRRGFACTVGEAQTHFNNNLPSLIRINAEAFTSYQRAQGRDTPQNMASASTCTSCHYLGLGQRAKTCQLVREAIGNIEGRGLSEHSRQFPQSHWMPPEDQWPQILKTTVNASDADRQRQARAYQRYYSQAILAVQFCCKANNYDAEATVNGRSVKICQGSFDRFPQAQSPCGEKAPPLHWVRQRKGTH